MDIPKICYTLVEISIFFQNYILIFIVMENTWNLYFSPWFFISWFLVNIYRLIWILNTQPWSSSEFTVVIRKTDLRKLLAFQNTSNQWLLYWNIYWPHVAYFSLFVPWHAQLCFFNSNNQDSHINQAEWHFFQWQKKWTGEHTATAITPVSWSHVLPSGNQN